VVEHAAVPHLQLEHVEAAAGVLEQQLHGLAIKHLQRKGW
jgi:hypothetical protein